MVPACQDDAGPWSYDPEAAKKRLDEAGWTVGADGIREKDGQKLSLRFTLPQGVPTTENEAGLLQSQLAEVGITLTLDGVDTDKFQTEYVRKSNFEITGFTWLGTQYPIGNLGQVYSSTGGSNYSKISVP